MTNTPKRVSSQEILDWVTDLHEKEQVVSREVLTEVTGIKLSIVDEHLRNLVNTGKIKRVTRGVFVPVRVMQPARLISTSLLPDGWLKIEVGDDVMTLTPREARMLGTMMQGYSSLASQIDIVGQVMCAIHNAAPKDD